MEQFLNLFFSFLRALFNLLNGITFKLGNFDIYYGWLIVALIISGMVISIFWKGARS